MKVELAMDEAPVALNPPATGQCTRSNIIAPHILLTDFLIIGSSSEPNSSTPIPDRSAQEQPSTPTSRSPTPPRPTPAAHKLPIEIRLKIWRFVPGPQHVSLMPCCTGQKEECGKGKCGPNDEFGRKVSVKLPVTLHINRESRAVALKHYTLLYPQQAYPVDLRKPCMSRPVCFDPTIDSLYMTESCFFYKKWFLWLFDRKPELMRAIRYLEVREVEFLKWNAFATNYLLDFHYLTEWPIFQGLKILTITVKKTTTGDNPRATQEREIFMDAGLQWLENYRDWFINGKVPKLKMHNHGCLMLYSNSGKIWFPFKKQ